MLDILFWAVVALTLWFYKGEWDASVARKVEENRVHMEMETLDD